MIICEVEPAMDAALRDEYPAWLRGHVADMLALPGFFAAQWFERREPPPAEGRWVVVASYRLRDRAAWDNCLAHHAKQMRAAGIERFGTRVEASRRLLEDA